MKTEIVNPLWLRLWHAMQALLFLILMLTGLSMHLAGTFWAWIPFSVAVKAHNASGIANAALWIFFVVANVVSGHQRHYLPGDVDFIHSTVVQAKYYGHGMFRGDPPPISPGLRNNHIQQLAYAIVMYVLMPISTASGVLLLFPILAPEHVMGRPGLWPIAILHLILGYFLTLFLIAHVYLATTGETFFALFREMITGDRAPRA
ncbi:MAG: cytochrome b [bacterium]|nr:cytochrome B [Deltaproteobacteria bacterium]MCP4903584.1 cytochrome b [bacterium]